jgi:hypothetical protein
MRFSRLYENRDGMAEEIKALTGVQAEVVRIRRLAEEISDFEISRRLNAFADEIERGAQEFIAHITRIEHLTGGQMLEHLAVRASVRSRIVLISRA